MAGMHVLFVDRHHFSSRLAAAYFQRQAPAGLGAASAGLEPLPLPPPWRALFSELGVSADHGTPVALEAIGQNHFDLIIGIGLNAIATRPMPSGHKFPPSVIRGVSK